MLLAVGLSKLPVVLVVVLRVPPEGEFLRTAATWVASARISMFEVCSVIPGLANVDCKEGWRSRAWLEVFRVMPAGGTTFTGRMLALRLGARGAVESGDNGKAVTMEFSIAFAATKASLGRRTRTGPGLYRKKCESSLVGEAATLRAFRCTSHQVMAAMISMAPRAPPTAAPMMVPR